MNLAQKYAYAVFRNGSFSKAAKQLFISQPSLSEMVKKLERELGFLLFDRSKSPLTLTVQGEVYIRYLEEAFENERIMLSRIKSLSKAPSRELSIRAGSMISRTILPIACREFLKIYDDANINLDFNDNTLNKARGDFNFMLNYKYNVMQLIGIPLYEEQYFLAFTNDCVGAELLKPMALCIDEVMSRDKFTPDKRLYEIPPDELSIMMKDLYLNSPELESYVKQIPRASCRVMNTRHRGVYYDLMLMGIGCIFTTDMIAAIERHRSQNVFFVPIENKRTLYLTYKKNRILSDEEKNFICIMQKVCNKASLL